MRRDPRMLAVRSGRFQLELERCAVAVQLVGGDSKGPRAVGRKKIDEVFRSRRRQ